MDDLLCPFSAPLIKGDFACHSAKEIVRRGGAEIACEAADSHSRCYALHAVIKAAALRTMNLADDLLTLPHSVLVKIQYGGVLGLKNQLIASETGEVVEDIAVLVDKVMQEFVTLENIPLNAVINTIMDFKAQTRRNRRK